MNAERKPPLDLGDALVYLELALWASFGTIGPVVWMHRLFDAGRYLALALVGAGWVVSMVFFVRWWFTKRSAMFCLVLLVLWIVAVSIVFA